MEKIIPTIISKIVPTITINPIISSDQEWYCYILVAKDGRRTYIGKTNDLVRRLRQHNGEIAGGAKSTRGHGPFRYAFYIAGFHNETDALCFEWAMHHPTGHPRRRRKPGLRGAVSALISVTNKERWTQKCLPACDTPLTVHWDRNIVTPPASNLFPEYISHSVITAYP